MPSRDSDNDLYRYTVKKINAFVKKKKKKREEKIIIEKDRRISSIKEDTEAFSVIVKTYIELRYVVSGRYEQLRSLDE